jgi:hypothetical protein
MTLMTVHWILFCWVYIRLAWLLLLVMARPTKPKASAAPKPEPKQKKHVSFLIPHESEKPIPLSPLPPTPSPSYSQSSLPSSASIRTPLPHPLSPTRSPIAAPPSIHELLSSPLTVVLDISRPPLPDTLHIHHTHLTQYATYPPVYSLHIVSPGLPWTICVAPTSSSGQWVTVFDVLHTLYSNLHKRVKQIEFDVEPQIHRDRISTVWFKRLERIADPSARLMEKQKGLRRVDFLLGRTRIVGFRFFRASKDITTWVVDFGT